LNIKNLSWQTADLGNNIVQHVSSTKHAPLKGCQTYNWGDLIYLGDSCSDLYLGPAHQAGDPEEREGNPLTFCFCPLEVLQLIGVRNKVHTRRILEPTQNALPSAPGRANL
jgi:hypothetical protein